MNRSALLLLMVVPIAIGLSGPVRADDRSEINALYSRLEQALKNETPENTLALETPDFRSYLATGKTLTGRGLVQQMKQQNAAVKSIKDVNIRVKTAKIVGKTAKVTTDFSYAVLIDDKDGHIGPKGATHEMAMRGEVRNDLVKTAAGWKFKTMREGKGKILIDGQPVRNAPPRPGQRAPKR
jgi:hypothetical protein